MNPVEPRKDSMPEVYAFTGLAAAFRKVGFSEVLRRSETRPIMRYVIGEKGKKKASTKRRVEQSS